ncbi:TonB-dependent receptor [candidate division KSB1 bacterium]|nr:TonB-dependent receptor [candidate division KSB1 bacterium]
MKTFFLIISMVTAGALAASDRDHEHIVNGAVYGLFFHEVHQDTVPLVSANIYWANSTVGTTSDRNACFSLPTVSTTDRLVVRYVGYESDTLTVQPHAPFLAVFLKNQQALEEVMVQAERPHSLHDMHATVNTQFITRQGLRTLACCNMAESFENTASVDVEQTDAVSGAKRIKMLGLAGFYTQLLVEKNPLMRGLISPFSLEYIPGFWIDSIDISKGTASVATGYESITGQINVELKKPENDEPIALYAYQSSKGRSELTFTGAKKLTPRITTMLLSYGSYNRMKFDHNGDTFLDMPLVTHISLMNRWKFSVRDKDVQLGFKVVHDNRDGGQMDFDFGRLSSSLYGSRNRVRRYEMFVKAGTLIGDNSSLALIFSGYQHRQESFWGLKNYSGDESSAYANLIFERIGDRHNLSTGLSYQFDNRDEYYQNDDYATRESVPGAFIEYTFKPNNRLTTMAGFRVDDHNLYGMFYTPRLHVKYQADAVTSLRFSAGKGYRVPHVFIDNPSILASSRELRFVEKLAAEEAWNAGVQMVRDFKLGADRPATLSLDFYRTEFQNQVVVDMEQDARTVLLYNLDGRSYSNSAQIELTATVTRGLEVTTAYRFNDVKTTYMAQLRELPLNPCHKGLLVVSYTVPSRTWQFDVTTQFNGRTRLPDTGMNPPQYRLDVHSPSYMQLFVQMTRKFNAVELFLGIENLTGYRQSQPILAWSEPFSTYFDSSMIWGPMVGRRFYFGVRLN